MRLGLGPKAVVAAAEAVDMVAADTVAEETAADVVVTVEVVDMVTSVVAVEIVADGVADARNSVINKFRLSGYEAYFFSS
jgi:hypothetical protein